MSLAKEKPARYTSKVSFDTFGDNVPNDGNNSQFSYTLQVSLVFLAPWGMVHS